MLRGQRRLGYILIAPAMVIIGLFIFYPIFEAFRMSLYNRILTKANFEFVWFETYKLLFTTPVFKVAFKNTIAWFICAPLLGMFFGSIIGIIIAQGENRIIKIVSLLILIPFVAPDVVVAAIWDWIFDANLGILNALIEKIGLLPQKIDWLGTERLAFPVVIFVMAWRISPLGALLVQSSYKAIPVEIFEAAQIDGAGFMNRLRYIVLPLLKYPLIIGLLLTMMWVTQNLAIIHLMTGGGPGRSTEILSTYIYKLNFRFYKESEASAASVIYFGFILAVTLAYLTVFRRVWRET
jgi:multiple sugar transport system permease protein